MKVLGFVISDEATDLLGNKCCNSVCDLWKKLDQYEKDCTEKFSDGDMNWFYTTNSQILEYSPHTFFDKIYIVTLQKGARSLDYIEVWPNTEKWTVKDIRPAHNFRKLLMPYLKTFVYSKEQLEEQAIQTAKELSYSGVTEYKDKYYKDGKEVSYDEAFPDVEK